jgi:hypothetical protein
LRHTQILPLTSYSNSREFERKNLVGVWLVILVLCLLPFERMMLPLGLRVVDIPLVLLILCALTGFLFLGQRFHFPLLMPVWLIFLASLIATMESSTHFDSILAILQEVYIYTWFIILTNVLSSFALSNLERFMKIWCVIGLMEATVTFMGMLNLGPDFFFIPPDGERALSFQGFNRAIGTDLNPNAAASYLSISFFLLLAMRWRAWLRLVFGIWLLVGIFATGSMAGLLSTIVSFAALIVVYISLEHHRIGAYWGTVFGVGVTVVALLITILWLLLSSGAGSIGGGEIQSFAIGRFSRSLESRFALIERAWSIYIESPLGTGPNSFASYKGTLHNDYLAFLFERGPLGAIGLMWLVGAALLGPLRVAFWQTEGYRRWQMLSLGAGFLACAVNAFSHEVSHFRQVWVLMAFVFATSYTLSAQLAEKRVVK